MGQGHQEHAQHGPDNPVRQRLLTIDEAVLLLAISEEQLWDVADRLQIEVYSRQDGDDTQPALSVADVLRLREACPAGAAPARGAECPSRVRELERLLRLRTAALRELQRSVIREQTACSSFRVNQLELERTRALLVVHRERIERLEDELRRLTRQGDARASDDRLERHPRRGA